MDGWVEDPFSKFMRMWAAKGWDVRTLGEGGCWQDLGGARFFVETLEGRRCDRNWMSGAWGSGEYDHPVFPSPAPALLGFDSTIWEYCSEQVGSDTNDFSQQELAKRCVWSNNNILRMVQSEWQWNMCQNLVWQLCAANGMRIQIYYCCQCAGSFYH